MTVLAGPEKSEAPVGAVYTRAQTALLLAERMAPCAMGSATKKFVEQLTPEKRRRFEELAMPQPTCRRSELLAVSLSIAQQAADHALEAITRWEVSCAGCGGTGRRAELASKLRGIIAGKAKERQRLSQGRGKKGPLNLADLNRGETRAEVAKLAGMAPETLRKAEIVMKGAARG